MDSKKIAWVEEVIHMLQLTLLSNQTFQSIFEHNTSFENFDSVTLKPVLTVVSIESFGDEAFICIFTNESWSITNIVSKTW